VTRNAGAILLVVFVLVGGASAQVQDSRVASAIRIDWERLTDRPLVEGYVYNDSDYRIGLVRLRVSARQPGQPATDTLAWVYGNVPAHGRWYFRVRVPMAQEVLGISIESFSLIARDPPHESP
jgi:hypothetical protein